MKDIKTHEQTLTLEVADGYEAKTRVSIDGNLCVEIMPDATKKETDITILRLMADGYEDVGIAGPVKAGDRVITESWEVAKGDHCNMDIPACDWDVPPRAIYRKKKLTGRAKALKALEKEVAVLVADGYEDIGRPDFVRAGDAIAYYDGVVYVPNVDGEVFYMKCMLTAVYRKKKLTGKDWLEAQKVGTVFRLHKTLYVKGFYHVESDNGEAFMFWASDFWDCSDETCEVLV